jgi:hypothetical protein
MASLNLLPSSLKSPVSVVCHDAGAANLIFAWLRHWSVSGKLDLFEFKLLFQGPAENIWRKNPAGLARANLKTSLDDVFVDSGCLLSGTGWASDLEHDARLLAAKLKIPAIAVIDHWVNYEQRFEREGSMVLPNEIWVSDPYAFEIANNLFAGISVVELPNTYLDNLVKAIPPVSKECKNLLYVMEPIRNNWGKEELGEFQALDYFVKNLSKIVGNEVVNITLRPHPSDPPDKYSAWMESHSELGVQLDSHLNLSDAIANARWVVGAETFAMVIACEAGRQTYSSLPPWANRCSLPLNGIIHLRDIA